MVLIRRLVLIEYGVLGLREEYLFNATAFRLDFLTINDRRVVDELLDFLHDGYLSACSVLHCSQWL